MKVIIILVLVFLTSCIKQPNNQKQSKLQQAVFYGTITAIKNSINNGAQINQPIGCGEFLPLEGALVIDDQSKFDFLISIGAKANERCLKYAKKHKNKYYCNQLTTKK